MRFSDANDMVDRLYEELVHALGRSRQDAFAAPVTVAEIYQELVPYRSMREQVGFGMNADYEHALLRLLAGDGDWVQLEPASARDIILRELNSPNPNVSIYREYAGCDVWVKAPPPGAFHSPAGAGDPVDDEEPDWLAALAEDEEPAGRPSERGEGGSSSSTGSGSGSGSGGGAFSFAELVDLQDELDDAPARRQPPAEQGPAAGQPVSPPAQPVSAPAQPASAPAQPASAPAQPASAPAQQAPSRGGGSEARAAAGAAAPRAGGNGPTVQVARCVFCDSSLPAGRQVRFCPFCGGDQQMRPCGACGEALEGGWSFCVSCGTPAED